MTHHGVRPNAAGSTISDLDSGVAAHYNDLSPPKMGRKCVGPDNSTASGFHAQWFISKFFAFYLSAFPLRQWEIYSHPDRNY